MRIWTSDLQYAFCNKEKRLLWNLLVLHLYADFLLGAKLLLSAVVTERRSPSLCWWCCLKMQAQSCLIGQGNWGPLIAMVLLQGWQRSIPESAFHRTWTNSAFSFTGYPPPYQGRDFCQFYRLLKPWLSQYVGEFCVFNWSTSSAAEGRASWW